jgi:23S rRNA pseudouridine2605 synthase
MSGCAGAQRVQKLLASAGWGSRRACETLIAAGRVAVDGETVSLGARADPATQRVTVDGEPLPLETAPTYLLLNKPAGVITSAGDPHGRPSVTDFAPANPRVYPVGRLDRDTEGLVLLTNDGDLAHRLAHPRYAVAKTYTAQVDGRVSEQALVRLSEGLELDGRLARPQSVRSIGATTSATLVELSLVEGRNREVRRLLGGVGLFVRRLARVALGPLQLGEIGQGKVRPLTDPEVAALREATDLAPAANPA